MAIASHAAARRRAEVPCVAQELTAVSAGALERPGGISSCLGGSLARGIRYVGGLSEDASAATTSRNRPFAGGVVYKKEGAACMVTPIRGSARWS
jgi:hypothetical protein